MKIAISTAVLMSLQLLACGSSTDGPDPSAPAGGFNPPAVPEGYTRFTSPTVRGVEPGADVTFCQYVMAPTDHDVDILDVRGQQSKFGHHAVAFSYKGDGSQEIGASVPCMGTEFSAGTNDSTLSMGAFLGGIGGETSAESAPLPDGVVFRLKQGSGIMLNVHYLNAGTELIDGDAVLDVKFADADPSRKVAAMFLNLNFGFSVTPASRTESSVDCVAKSDVEILMMSNHMHEFGTRVSTQIVRAGSGVVEMMHDDPKWTYEMQFNAVYTKWTADSPFLIHAGDTIRTTCAWENPTSETMGFPREMCIGVGFALATGDRPTSPACFGGFWVPEFG